MLQHPMAETNLAKLIAEENADTSAAAGSADVVLVEEVGEVFLDYLSNLGIFVKSVDKDIMWKPFRQLFLFAQMNGHLIIKTEKGDKTVKSLCTPLLYACASIDV